MTTPHPHTYLHPQPQPPPYPQPGLKSGLAVAALICGLLAPFGFAAAGFMAFLLGAAAIVCGVLALRQISRGEGAGRGMAVWGLVLGIFFALAGMGSMAPATPAPLATSASQPGRPAVAFAAPAAAAPAASVPSATSIPGKGTFLVGPEVQPGTYRSSGAKQGFFEFCSWTRLRDTTGNSGSTVAFGTANANDPMIVTIAATDGAFQSSNCEDWTRIK